MNEKPSLDLVYLAVASLNNRDSNENEKASQWLNDLQKSVYAWTIADEILHQKKDLQSCYFAAQTMRSKIQHSFHELPQDAHDSLRNSLVEHISQIDENTNSAIVTQLCLALADLALQMTMWKRASLDLLGKFSQTNIWPLLEILTVLPEEVESRAIRLGENRRVELLQEFTECAPAVNNFLVHCAHLYPIENGDNVPFNTKILRCFTSWVGAFNAQIMLNNVVLMRAFTVLNIKRTDNQEGGCPGALHDAATDCICSILQSLIISLNGFEDGPTQGTEFEVFLFNNIVHLEEAYHMTVVKENEEKSMNFCRIFTELAESFLETIILQSKKGSFHYAFKALDLVLTCVGHHDYEVAEITFNLWYMLSEELYHKNDKDTNQLFKPYVERLIAALGRHCQMEIDQEGLLADGDDFKDFRLKVSDLIKDIVFIVGSSNCFKHMFYNLQNVSTSWDVLEASLFVMQAVAKNITPTEDEIVPLVVKSILNLQSHTMHIAVQHTVITLLGELCEWIEKHPATLDPILNFLVPFLPQQQLGATAATALQNICVTCNEQITRHVPFLMQILHQVDTFAISNDAVNGLLRGMAAIIGFMPPPELTAALKEVCYLQVNPLCQLIDQDVTIVKGTKADPVLWLDRLSSIMRNITVKHRTEINPCKPVVLEIWPVISKTLSKYQTESRIMERCCRCIRFMIRSVSQEVKEILEGLVGQIITIYSVHRHSCFLYLGSILVDEYASDSTCTQGLLDMLRAFIVPTFEILQKENGLRNHPDTVDDFFRLCARFVQRAPLAFLECDCVNPVLQCALLSCLLDHKEANASVMKFIYDLISTGHVRKRDPDYDKRRKLVGKILSEIGQPLVCNLIQTSVFYLHSYMLCEVGDVIVELLEFDRSATEKWLMVALEQLPKQNNGVMAATPNQLKDVYMKISGSKASRAITHELKILSRYYR